MGDGRLRDLVAYWGWTVFSFTKWNFFVLTNAFLDLKKRNPLVLTTATEARTGKKAKVLISKTTILHVYQAFCTFRCCHYKAVTWKCLISSFREGHEHRTTTFFSFPELWYSPFEFNFRKRDGIRAIKPFEAARMRFLSDVFVTVAFVFA